MKKMFLLAVCLLVTACASPPQPYGSRTPVNINHNAFQEVPLEHAEEVILDAQ